MVKWTIIEANFRENHIGIPVAFLLRQVLCHEEWQMCVMMMGYQVKTW
jgi:hypothetical protein